MNGESIESVGLPFEEHMERAVLGTMLLEPVAVNDAVSRLKAEDFFLTAHQTVFRCIQEMSGHNLGIDSLSVRNELKRRRELDRVGGDAYILDLTTGIPWNFNIEHYVEVVKEKAMLRQVHAIGQEAANRALDQGEVALDLISDVETLLLNLSETGAKSGLSSIPELVKESFSPVDTLYSGGAEITGLETHYTEFDRMTAGLQDSELIIIAARPSMGKTAWAINIAQNAAVQDGKVVAVFSLEMSKESLFRRMLASQARVSGRKMQTGFIGEQGRREVIAALGKLMETHIHIDDTAGITLAEMRAKARQLKQRVGSLHLIVVDYLQLMSGGGGLRRGSNRTEEVSALSRGLKALAKEMRVPVIAVSQLSRANEQRGGDKRPILSDLRESGSIEQDADVVAFLHREEYYDRDNPDLKGLAEAIIAKQRNGPTGTIPLAWLEECTRFENLATY